jgi:hypothetical protein
MAGPNQAFFQHGTQQQPLAAESGERRQTRHGGHRDRGCGEGEGHRPTQAAEVGQNTPAGAKDKRCGDEEQDAFHHQVIGDEVKRGDPAKVAHQRDCCDDIATLAHT